LLLKVYNITWNHDEGATKGFCPAGIPLIFYFYPQSKIMPFQLEKKLVEEWMIEKLKENGWNYIESENLKRLNLGEP